MVKMMSLTNTPLRRSTEVIMSILLILPGYNLRSNCCYCFLFAHFINVVAELQMCHTNHENLLWDCTWYLNRGEHPSINDNIETFCRTWRPMGDQVLLRLCNNRPPNQARKMLCPQRIMSTLLQNRVPGSIGT